MDKDTEKLLGGMAFGGSIAAVLVCGVGLFMMGLEGSVSTMHFIRLGMATAGATLVGAVGGIFLVASVDADKEKKKVIEQPETPPATAAEDRSA